jgi:hypothetical protein
MTAPSFAETKARRGGFYNITAYNLDRRDRVVVQGPIYESRVGWGPADLELARWGVMGADLLMAIVGRYYYVLINIYYCWCGHGTGGAHLRWLSPRVIDNTDLVVLMTIRDARPLSQYDDKCINVLL